jgi:hypothetical protein
MKDKSVKKNSKRVVKDVEIPISNIFKGLKDVSS